MEITNDLKTNILLLPKEIQKKIYIYTWKIFWRNYVPLTAKIPSWNKRYNYVQKTLWEARLKNIHFLHLPFNTLPENKKWIMGCQCDFCINDKDVDIIEKHMHYLVQHRNIHYFPDFVAPESYSSNWNETNIYKINNFNEPIISLGKVFDPLCGSYKENKITKSLREKKPIQFTYIA